MIGFLLWMNANEKNRQLRERLDKYEPNPPEPEFHKGRQLVLLGVIVVAILLLAQTP